MMGTRAATTTFLEKDDGARAGRMPSMPGNWTKVRCGCETEHRREVWRKSPGDKKKGSIREALQELSRAGSLGQCENRSPYRIRMRQEYPHRHLVAYVEVPAAFQVPNIEGDDNQEIYLLVEERDKHREKTNLHVESDIVFEHRYWAEGSKTNGRLKYGQFGKQLSASQLEASLKFLSDRGWLRATPSGCRQK